MVLCAEIFTALLKTRDLHFTTNDLPDGGCCVSVPFDRRNTNFFFSGDDNGSHVAVRTLFESCPADRVPDLLVICNALNVKYRWVKFCIDKDNDIMVEDDAIVSPDTAGEECFELMARTVNILGEVKPIIMNGIYG